MPVLTLKQWTFLKEWVSNEAKYMANEVAGHNYIEDSIIRTQYERDAYDALVGGEGGTST